MVVQYYTDQITEYSRREVETVFRHVAPPAALLGGWAVHLQVNGEFETVEGHSYIGSRDIDIGVHVDPAWDDADLRSQPVGETIRGIGSELEFDRSRFGFKKTVDRETGETLTEEEATEFDLFNLFEVYIDIIPDTPDLDAFDQTFGFRPPDEPLLAQAFDGRSTPLSDLVDWTIPSSIVLVDPDVLAAMKVRSMPDRSKLEKQVKDIADLYVLLWYTEPVEVMIDAVDRLVTAEDKERFSSAVDQAWYEEVAEVLDVNVATVRGAIDRLEVNW